MVPKDNDIYSPENVPFYTQRDPTLCKKRVCEPEEMQWCDDRNESRTASCQHQRVSPCEGQDKIFYNMNVTANFVGLNTECTGDFGAIEKTCSLTGDFGPIAGLPGRAAMLGERNFSSSSGSVCEHMVNECHTENVPFYIQRDPTLCKKRVCELEEKQWRTDRNESGSTPCLTANCGELNTECTGDGGAFAGVPGRAAMPGDRNTASSGSLHEYMVNESHTENVPFYTRRDPTLCKKRVCELEEKQWCTDRNESGTTFGQQRQGCNKCDESRAEGDPHVTSLPGEVSDLGKTCPQQGDLTIEEREDTVWRYSLLFAMRSP